MTAPAVTVHRVRLPVPGKGGGLLGLLDVSTAGIFIGGARLMETPRGPRLIAPRLAHKADRIRFETETWDALTAAAVEAVKATGSRIAGPPPASPAAGYSKHSTSLNTNRREGYP